MQWYRWGSCWAVQQFPDEFAVENKVNWVNVAANHYQCTREKPNQNTVMLPRRNYSLVWRFLSSQPIESLLVALKFFYLYLLCMRSISVTFLCGWSLFKRCRISFKTINNDFWDREKQRNKAENQEEDTLHYSIIHFAAANAANLP